MRSPAVVFLVAALVFGCGDDGDSSATDATPAADADPGVGCTATTPRSVLLESFVGPNGLEQRMIQAIGSAQDTIDLHMYLFTVRSIRDALIAAHQRGVAVRVLFDPDHEANAAVRPGLMSAGVPVRDNSSLYEFSHAKYLIVDGATAWIMSMNFNVDAMDEERNYGVVDRDPEDVADLRAIFEMDWAAGGGEAPKPADLTCTRLVVSPNNSKLRILELINSATSTLEVEVMYISETNVRNAIGMAKARGVNVRVILGDDMVDPDVVTYFKNQQIPVKGRTNAFRMHAKLIIADGVAFVGSENMSQTSLTRNREVGVMAFEPAETAPIETQFESDWNASPTL